MSLRLTVAQALVRYLCVQTTDIGFSDSDILNRKAQLKGSLRLTQWLRCRYGIGIKNVIGHNESLSSPYHRERVARLRNQTHGDMRHSSMVVYRRKLRTFKCG